MIHYILIQQLDNALKVEEQEVIEYVAANDSLPAPSSYKDQEVNFALVQGHWFDTKIQHNNSL